MSATDFLSENHRNTHYYPENGLSWQISKSAQLE